MPLPAQDRPLIASRTFRVRTEEGERDVPVRIFAPYERGGAWHCRTEIDWPDRTWAIDASGQDSAQALYIAMELAGVRLYTSDYHADDAFIFTDWIGYGFPVPKTLRDMLIGHDAKYM